MTRLARRAGWFTATALSALTLGLAGCAQSTGKPLAPSEAAERAGQRALRAGIRAYNDGQYAAAETQLGKALASGLDSARDRAAAHKYLAFIYCTSNRGKQCEAAFRAARQADPMFALNKSEAGHPVWGPVYRRAWP